MIGHSSNGLHLTMVYGRKKSRRTPWQQGTSQRTQSSRVDRDSQMVLFRSRFDF